MDDFPKPNNCIRNPRALSEDENEEKKEIKEESVGRRIETKQIGMLTLIGVDLTDHWPLTTAGRSY
jgi:hypothetical protein